MLPTLLHSSIIILLICTASKGLAQELEQYVPEVVVVQFETGQVIGKHAGATGLQGFDQKSSKFGVHGIERVYPFLDYVEETPRTYENLIALRNTYYVRFDSDTTPQQVAEEFSYLPGVVYSEPVTVNYTSDLPQRATPNDALFGVQTELIQLGLSSAWDIVKSEKKNPRVVIAIVDNGAQWNHEDLLLNVWKNTGEIASNGIDDDGNGFIDDLHGINFSNGDNTNNDPSGIPSLANSGQHGTNAAGLASAVSNNSKGIAGAAWNAQLMHINAGCSWSARNICYGYEGILAAAANGADIINASWGGYVPWDGRARFAEQSLELATDMGSLIVAAAGNSSYDLDVIRDYPARHPRVLSVGATEKDTRTVTGFSNYGKLVNVFAPGARVATTGLNNSYYYVYGTSFSSPLVAGIAALVKTQNPSWSPDRLREQIRVTSDNIDRINPSYHGQTGRGYVNALKAVGSPSASGIRLVKWSWTDGDDNLIMSPNDEVTITVELVNHLSDASQLTVGLTNAESYPYLQWLTQSVNVGTLNGGDTTKVDLKFKVGANAPANQRIRLFTDIRNGTFSDQADMLSFQLNQKIELLHQGLKSLYTATNGDAWTKKTNWDISKVPSESEFRSWYGVGFSERRLFLLDLSENNLSGTLPTNLSNLRQLEFLYLNDNILTGSIPSELGQLSELSVFYIENNSLTGSLPSELGNLSKMENLDVSNNKLSGSIPTQLAQLSKVELLKLNNNSFTGTIPSGLGDLPNLSRLWLSHNSLTGDIPSNLGQLTGLGILTLHDNSLTGSIPASLGNLKRLSVLTVSNNSLTGGIPTQLGGLPRLEYLWLSSNSLTGGIPTELANLVSLQDLRLHKNSLSGAIPSQLGNLSELEILTFHDNSLTGQIPSELGKLSKLEVLSVSDNSLTGSVPPELGNLSNLQQLFLSNNSLTGELPRSFLKLKNLKKLSFKGQDLCAPQDAEFLSWLNSIDEVDSVPCNSNNTNLIEQEIGDHSFVRGTPIDPIVLPEASIGASPFVYTLSQPLPKGLKFDETHRTISGTPTEVSPPVALTYLAMDNNGLQGSQQFTIEVIASVGTESRALPEEFSLQSNYPNPFRNVTHLVFDLPWAASIEVEVMDMTGRRVYVQPAAEVSPGWGREIEMNGMTLPSGSYVYRMTVASPEGSSTYIGNFVRLR